MYTNHKVNPGIQLFSTFVGDRWREKDCIRLDFIFSPSCFLPHEVFTP